MCLNYQKDFPLRTKDGTITVWKVITRRNTGEYRYYVWDTGANKSAGTALWDHSTFPYPAGFHCLTTRKDARRYGFGGCLKLIKVEINPKDVVALGYQQGLKVIVAKKVTVKSLKHQR